MYTDYFDRPPVQEEEEDMLLDETMADFSVIWPQSVVVQHTLDKDQIVAPAWSMGWILVLGVFLRFVDVCASMLPMSTLSSRGASPRRI